MEIEKVVIISDQNDVLRVERVIESLSQINKSLILGKIIHGRVGKDTLLSFNTDKQYYKFVLEKLRINNVKVIAKGIELDERAIETYMKKTTIESQGWDDVKKTGDTVLPLDKMVQAGQFEEIINVTKDIRNGINNIAEAKKRLPEALVKAIELSKRNFKSHSHKQDDSIETLVALSSNQYLKSPLYNEFTKSAIIAAVELLASERDQLYKLINICNNNKIHNLGVIKAAVKFAEIVFENPVIFESDLDIAVKKLNLRWLMICFPMVEHELDQADIKNFNQLVEYISSKR